MLSVNPISFNQKNRQSTPVFKGLHTLTHENPKVVGNTYYYLEELIKTFRPKIMSRLTSERKNANEILVNCSDKDDKLVSPLLKMLAEIFEMTYIEPKSL